jgi:hypothetical protein
LCSTVLFAFYRNLPGDSNFTTASTAPLAATLAASFPATLELKGSGGSGGGDLYLFLFLKQSKQFD